MFGPFGKLVHNFKHAALGFTNQQKMKALARSALSSAVHGNADGAREIINHYFEQEGERTPDDQSWLIRAAIRLDDPELLDDVTKQLGVSKGDYEFNEDVRPARGEAYYTCIPLLSQAIILRAKAVTLALLDDPTVDAAKPIRMRNIDPVYTNASGTVGEKTGAVVVTPPGQAEKELHTPDMLAAGQYGWGDVLKKIAEKTAAATVAVSTSAVRERDGSTPSHGPA